MANLSYRLPAEIEEEDCREWLETAIEHGKPGPEIQSIRANVPGVMRSFTLTRKWIYHDGVLDFDLKELLRAYIALSADCVYCSNQGIAQDLGNDEDELFQLLNFETSERYTEREKVALRYAERIMWTPETAADDQQLWSDLHARFTEQEIIELGYWVGFTFGGQRWIKTLGAAQGELADAIDASLI